MTKTVSILTVTGLGERKGWLLEAAQTVQREKANGIPVSWFLCVRGEEVIPSEIVSIVDVLLRVPLKTHVSYARNLLLAYVVTEYVCTLDDDDVLIDGGVAHRLAAFERAQDIGWVAGHMQDVDVLSGLGDVWEQPAVAGEYHPGELLDVWGSPENWFVCISHSFMMRSALVQRLGGWKLISQEDIMLVCQVSHLSKGVILPHPVIGYRRHDSQISRSPEEVRIRAEASKVIFDHLAAT